MEAPLAAPASSTTAVPFACGTCAAPVCDCFGSVASAMALCRQSIQRAALNETTSKYNILPEVVALKNILVDTRRHLHQHPELSYQEVNTAKYLKAQIEDIAQSTGACFETVQEQVDGTTGMWVDLVLGDGQGPTVLLRADMDALPIQESGNKPYKSQNDGCMHACGHDAHMSILMGAIRVLANDANGINDSSTSLDDRSAPPTKLLRGKVRFLFQPAEEGGAGALRMIQGGCLDGVDRVFGLHVWNFMEAGVVGVAPGPITAFSDRIFIDIIGAGGHGSMPQGTVDAVLVAAHLTIALHSGVVSRSVDPFEAVALTIGRIEGGEVANAIAGKASLKGTVRTRNAETKKIVMQRITEICSGVGVTFGAKIELNYKHGYPATVSSEKGANDVRVAALPIVGSDNIVPPHPTLAGEDMSYYLEQRDGAFFFVGSKSPDESVVPHHRADFDIDETCMDVGASVMVTLIRNLCGGEKEILAKK